MGTPAPTSTWSLCYSSDTEHLFSLHLSLGWVDHLLLPSSTWISLDPVYSFLPSLDSSLPVFFSYLFPVNLYLCVFAPMLTYTSLPSSGVSSSSLRCCCSLPSFHLPFPHPYPSLNPIPLPKPCLLSSFFLW